MMWYNKTLLAKSIPNLLFALFWLVMLAAVLAGIAQTISERLLP